MVEYISTKEAAIKWGISERRVQKLCEDGRIDDIIRFGHVWMIPRVAQKLIDNRKRTAKEQILHNKKDGGILE
ncbi:MAG: helix-turn-helix domain-containing protein [Ruminococcus flavefaciens]|nr:helix-turn-helix domain-containing protein [Ruminococcus flavefaciens]MCM1362754.1 helix-turn-helix domain-containing protein [Clostridiales bacterium]